jgi:hypothetical protein
LFRGYFEEFDDAPPDIAWFERLWLSTLAVSVIITITMFDWSVNRVGPYGAVLLTSARFGGTFLLMFLCSRRRSNLMRWVIAIPFRNRERGRFASAARGRCRPCHGGPAGPIGRRCGGDGGT